MIFDWLKSHKDDEKSKIVLPAPLNLRLGSAVELDLLPLQMIREQLRCTLRRVCKSSKLPVLLILVPVLRFVDFIRRMTDLFKSLPMVVMKPRILMT